MQINGQNFAYQYDSGKGQRDDEYQKTLSNLYDQVLFSGKYRVRLGPSGRLLELKGLSKVLEDTNPGLNILDYHGLNLRDETFALFLQQALGRLPDKKQDKWQVETKASLGEWGSVTGLVDFTRKPAVKINDRPCAQIDVAGKQTADLEMKWLNIPLKGTVQTTKLKGTLWFDAKAGALERSTVEMATKGELKIGSGVMKLTFQHQLEMETQR